MNFINHFPIVAAVILMFISISWSLKLIWIYRGKKISDFTLADYVTVEGQIAMTAGVVTCAWIIIDHCPSEWIYLPFAFVFTFSSMCTYHLTRAKQIRNKYGRDILDEKYKNIANKL